MKPYAYLFLGSSGQGALNSKTERYQRQEGQKRYGFDSMHYGTYGDESYFYFEILQWLHLLVALAVWVIATIMFFMIFTCTPTGGASYDDVCRPYGTTTFLSTTDGLENRGWPVATDKPGEWPASKSNFWPLDPYYTCMQTAGIANATCSTSMPLDQYITCVTYQPATKAALSTCMGYVSNNIFAGWPNGDQFMSCVFNSPVLGGLVQSRKVRNGFKACMDQTVYPFFEAAVSPDSNVFLGSYNWGIVGALGLLGFSFFAVYTGSPSVVGKVHYGKVGSLQKLGGVWGAFITVVCLAMWVANFCLFWYGNNNQFDNATTGIITFSVLSALVGYFGLEWMDYWFGEYVVSDVRNPWELYKHGKTHVVTRRDERIKGEKEAREAEEQADYYRNRGSDMGKGLEVPANLGLMPFEGEAMYPINEQNVDAYTSPLLAIWSDGYVVCDCLMWLGMAGATGQVTTDYVWNVFTLVILFRVNNANIARLLYECFHTDRADSREVDRFKTENPALHVPQQHKAPPKGYHQIEGVSEIFLDLKVLALSLQLANVMFFVALLYVVFNPQQLTAASWTPFWWFAVLGFIIPEGIRFLLHLYCQMKYSHHHGMTLLMTFQFLFLWDLIVRLILFIVVVWWGDNSNLFGTRGFLRSEYQYVMVQALSYFMPI